MKINSYNQNQTSFKSGLTPLMKQQIEKINPVEISNKFADLGITSNFKGDKTIAWSCNKIVDMFQAFNQKYNTKFNLPLGIFVEDFSKFKMFDYFSPAFCTALKSKLYKNSEKEIMPMTLFFNNYDAIKPKLKDKDKWLADWRNISEISDKMYEKDIIPTDNFLYHFLHEFAHSLHEGNLLKKLGGKKSNNIFNEIISPSYLEKFNQKYGDKVSQICTYASKNPMETVACDLPLRILDSIDKETLLPTKNPLKDTPYEDLTFMQRIRKNNYSDKDRPLDEILRKFYNGKFK